MEILLKSMLCLVVLLLVYRLFLQQETTYRFNRFYLLFAVAFSFVIPFVTIEHEAQESFSPIPQQAYVQEVISSPDYPIEIDNSVPNTTVNPTLEVNWILIAWAGYGLISLLLLVRFIRNIQVLRNKIKHHVQISYRGELLIILEEESLPFSFLKYIFVSKSDLDSGKFTDAVFEHERTHVVEKHSWDILFIEGLLVFFWFHPGLYLAKTAIKLNHEFIADQVAIQSIPIVHYQKLLLSFSTPGSVNSFASSLNFSLTKKRLEMMKRKSKSSIKWIKIAILIPIGAAAVYLFSDHVVAQKEIEPNVEIQPVAFFQTLNPSLQNPEIGSKAWYYSQTKFFIQDRAGKSVAKTYGQLTLSEQASLPNLQNKLEKKTPDAKLFESWKDNMQFAVWLDGNVIANQDLEKLDQQEIIHFFSSFVYLNARSERFPQPYQVSIYTKSGFEKAFGNDTESGSPLGGTVTIPFSDAPIPQIIELSAPLASYILERDTYKSSLEEGSHFIQKTEKEQAELLNQFANLNGKYLMLPENERLRAGKPKHPYAPFSKIESEGKISYKIWEDMTESEKAQFPNSPRFSKSTPELAIYESSLRDYEIYRNRGTHFIDKSSIDQELEMTAFAKAQNQYNYLEAENKKMTVPPTHPYAPYVKIESGVKPVFKLVKDLTEEERKLTGC